MLREIFHAPSHVPPLSPHPNKPQVPITNEHKGEAMLVGDPVEKSALGTSMLSGDGEHLFVFSLPHLLWTLE